MVSDLLSVIPLLKFSSSVMFAAVPRIQFLAIEVARNQEGCNDAVSDEKMSCCHTTDATV